MFLYALLSTLLLLCINSPLFSFSFFRNNAHPVTILLDPAGDARHTGRTLGNDFERGITLQCIEQLKRVIERTYPHVRVLLTRIPGEIEQPLQHANFANRLSADLYISIHFYQESDAQPHWYIYSFSYGDDFMDVLSSLTLYTYDKAYLFNKKTTQRWASSITQILTKEPYGTYYTIKGPYRLPLKPLIGTKAPAILFEIGLKKAEDWTRTIDAIATSLAPIIAECQS